MKKITKAILYIAGIFTLVLLSVSIPAETVVDETNDVYHWHVTEGSYGWDANIGNKPNIDITELSYTKSSTQVIITFKVAGSISDSELTSYWAYLNTSDSNYYFSWNQGKGAGMATSTKDDSYDMDFDPDIAAEGDTITATFNNVGTFESGIELWGWAVEYTTYGDMSGEWWGDWAPESYGMYDVEETSDQNGEDNETGDTDDGSSDTTDTGEEDDGTQNTDIPPPSGTPGFELFILITGIIAILLFIKKRK